MTRRRSGHVCRQAIRAQFLGAGRRYDHCRWLIFRYTCDMLSHAQYFPVSAPLRFRAAFVAFVSLFGLIDLLLLGAGGEIYEHLHLVLDTGNGLLSLMLVLFLLGERYEIRSNVRQYLAIGLAVASTTELLHALVGIEWSGALAWINKYAGTLRPATWPPSTYVLPLAMGWIAWLEHRQSQLRPAQFAIVMIALTIGLLWLSLSLPRYVDTGILGIQRPTQAPLLLLWAGVIVVYWRRRERHPLYEGLALMGGLLFLSDLCMVYSTSPHEKFAMMAHVGKLFAYSFMHWVQMQIGAEDNRVRRLAELDLANEKNQLAAALHELRHQKFALDQHAIVFITDVHGAITYANKQFCQISGYSEAELLGKNPRILNSGTHPREFFRLMWDAIASGEVWRGEICDRAKNGHLFWAAATIVPYLNTQGKPERYISIRSDITARKQAEEEVHQLAFYDPLTNLPNRRLLLDRLHQAMSSSDRRGTRGALIFIDLDHFKTLNDTQGHDIGDLLLIETARRITACVREDDTVARLGGDEFVVVLETLSQHQPEAMMQAELVAEKIRAALEQPYQLKDLTYRSSLSAGVVLFCGHEEALDNLFRHADTAMYQAKAAGRNAIRFYDPAMQAAIEARSTLTAELHLAIEREELRLFYQVQVDSQRRPLGAEVLLRWEHTERGLVSPAQFVPLAEETGLIVPMGLWVLRTACAQLRHWQADPLRRTLQLAVNVSARQFRQPDFVAQIARVLQESGVNPELLKLELTESIVLENVEETINKMREIKRLGVTFSMDDFGTGYSSLQYLKRLPLSQIKIDQSFVRDIATDPNDAAIVQTIIVMGAAMGLSVIAEGVETLEQAEFLQSRGCPFFQGYLFGKPAPIGEFERVVEDLTAGQRH